MPPEPRVGACQTQSPGWQLPGPAGAWVIPQEKRTLSWNAGFTSEECVRVLGAEERTDCKCLSLIRAPLFTGNVNGQNQAAAAGMGRKPER